MCAHVHVLDVHSLSLAVVVSCVKFISTDKYVYTICIVQLKWTMNQHAVVTIDRWSFYTSSITHEVTEVFDCQYFHIICTCMCLP